MAKFKPATMLASEVHVATFRCIFKKLKISASGEITTEDSHSRGQPIKWTAKLVQGDWNITPDREHRVFSFDQKLNNKIIGYIEMKLKSGRSFVLDDIGERTLEDAIEDADLVPA